MAEAGFVVCVVANEPQMRQARVRIDPARSAADNAAAAWRRVYKTDPPHSIQLAYTDGKAQALEGPLKRFAPKWQLAAETAQDTPRASVRLTCSCGGGED